MADIKKFMDRGGVSVLWSKVAEKVKAEETRAKLAEQAALEAAQNAQKDVDDLEKLVGVLPEETTAKDVVDYINIKTTGIATNAALTELQGKVATAQNAIDAIEADYLKAADKTELQGNIDTLTGVVETLRDGIDTDKVDGVKDLIAYVEAHGSEVTGMKDDIKANADAITALQAEDILLDGRLDVLEAKFGEGEGSVADQIADAKQAAIDAAAADATSKANAAEANAKSHAETKATEAKEAAIAAAATDATTKANAAQAAAEATAKAYADGLAGNYATAAQGAKADTALQAADIVTGSANGTIAVKGADVAVKGLGSAAYVETTAFDAAGTAATQASAAESAAKAYTDTEIAKIQALTSDEILAAIAEIENPQV